MKPLQWLINSGGEISLNFFPVQKQSDGYNCGGPFAIAYAAELIGGGNSPIDARFDVSQMRTHIMLCLQNKVLTPFPKLTGN